jgi:hypothetical protein
MQTFVRWGWLCSLLAVSALADERQPTAATPPAAPELTPREAALTAELAQARAKIVDLERELDRFISDFDVGVSAGLNTGAGIGVEADYRLVRDSLSLGLAAGIGLWGYKITPHARWYPFQFNFPYVFLEGGLSLNTGRPVIFETRTLEGLELDQRVDMRPTPVLNAALGVRLQLCDIRYLWFEFGSWLVVRAGYALRLYRDNVDNKSGFPLTDATRFALDAAQPGGWMIGASYGISPF